MSKNLEDKFDVILDTNSPTFADDLREAIGVKPGETVEIITPQFTRVDDIKPAPPQINFSALPTLADDTLKALGCGRWNDPDSEGRTLWLYPFEWYDSIPDGTPIIDINGERELFKRGETDDDMRCGMLAFGFYKTQEPP